MKKFGEYVHEARIEKAWTLKDLADKVGTFKGYICGIERGNVPPPSPKMVKKFCDALGLDGRRMLAMSWVEKRPAKLDLYAALEVIREVV